MVINKKAVGWCVLAVACLAAGAAIGAFFPRALLVGVCAGFVGYLICGRCAMALWRVDERIFESRPRIEDHRRRPRVPPIAIATVVVLAALALPCSLKGQQTIFNVPSADVLDHGKTYLELDVLGRPQDPNFALFTSRSVWGLGGNVEAGVNFGGFLVPGRSVPIATPNIKWQPWHNEKLAFTSGVFGLFYLRGNRDGSPAVLWYGDAAYKLTTTTRLTAGGYWASSGYAAPDPQAGALLGLEQKVGDHLNLIADWFSGENGLGYFTPGVSVPLSDWTIYAGYSIKNGDSEGNALLFEFGFTF